MAANQHPATAPTGRRRGAAVAAVAAAGLLAAAGTVAAVESGPGRAPAHSTAAPKPAASRVARLTASGCTGPTGAAYVSDTGWDGFSAIDTANCKVIQTYNVGDTQVPGFSGDYNYSSTNEGIAVHGSTLYFADTGTSTVAAIDASTLDPSNYNPDEKLINVGLFPQELAVTPDGTQLWVADTGAQTSRHSASDVAVVDTATDKVVARLRTRGAPSDIAFSPSGKDAYVTTAEGLTEYSTATRRVVARVGGLGDPRSVVVGPAGDTLYVTETDDNRLAVLSAASLRPEAQIAVGQMPWDVITSPDGTKVYVANPDSDTVSVIDPFTKKVSATVAVPGDPDTLGLTTDGSQLWVGGDASGNVTVVSTSSHSVVGTVALGDGYEPTAIALVATPTPGS